MNSEIRVKSKIEFEDIIKNGKKKDLKSKKFLLVFFPQSYSHFVFFIYLDWGTY